MDSQIECIFIIKIVPHTSLGVKILQYFKMSDTNGLLLDR